MYRQRSGIKLTSLEIIDFKNLQKGTISWQAAPTSFGVIAVRDFGGKFRYISTHSIKVN